MIRLRVQRIPKRRIPTILPEAEITWSTCKDAPCATVQVDDITWELSFTADGDRWVLSGLSH